MGLSFEMDGPVAAIVATGELTRQEIPELEQLVELAESNGAGAVLLDVRDVPRVPTSILGMLARLSRDLTSTGRLVGIIGLDRLKNPIIRPDHLAGRIAVFPDLERAQIEVRRRVGAVESHPTQP